MLAICMLKKQLVILRIGPQNKVFFVVCLFVCLLVCLFLSTEYVNQFCFLGVSWVAVSLKVDQSLSRSHFPPRPVSPEGSVPGKYLYRIQISKSRQQQPLHWDNKFSCMFSYFKVIPMFAQFQEMLVRM